MNDLASHSLTPQIAAINQGIDAATQEVSQGVQNANKLFAAFQVRPSNNLPVRASNTLPVPSNIYTSWTEVLEVTPGYKKSNRVSLTANGFVLEVHDENTYNTRLRDGTIQSDVAVYDYRTDVNFSNVNKVFVVNELHEVQVRFKQETPASCHATNAVCSEIGAPGSEAVEFAFPTAQDAQNFVNYVKQKAGLH
jgi:hypothetical protein